FGFTPSTPPVPVLPARCARLLAIAGFSWLPVVVPRVVLPTAAWLTAAFPTPTLPAWFARLAVRWVAPRFPVAAVALPVTPTPEFPAGWVTTVFPRGCN